MKRAKFIVLLLGVTLIAGCQKKVEEPVPPIESTPPTQVTETDTKPTTDVDTRLANLIKWQIFFPTDEEERSLNLKKQETIEDAFLAVPQAEREAAMKVLRGDGTNLNDTAIAAAAQLPMDSDNKEPYKKLLLAVPTDFVNNNGKFEQAAEAWGDLAADYFRAYKDLDILTALYTQSLDGHGGETVAYARVELAMDMPNDVLPHLNQVQLMTLGEYLEMGSNDLEANVNQLIALTQGSDPKLKSAAETVIRAFEAQQKVNELH